MFKYESDSRKVQKGQTFIALKGLTVDGHDFIEKAIENKEFWQQGVQIGLLAARTFLCSDENHNIHFSNFEPPIVPKTW